MVNGQLKVEEKVINLVLLSVGKFNANSTMKLKNPSFLWCSKTTIKLRKQLVTYPDMHFCRRVLFFEMCF